MTQPKTDIVHVTAIVVDYQPNAMSDTYDDGFESFDATRFRVLSPPDLTGHEFNVYSTPDSPPDSPWRAVGRNVAFDIARGDLAAGKTLFEGALSGIKVLP